MRASSAGGGPRRVGLTGGIGTGKSHVLTRFARLGAATIDADVLAREAVEPGTPGFTAVVRAFGPSVLDTDGKLDRRHLGRVVFSDPDARRTLEQIVHPDVRRRVDEWFASLSPAVRLGIADIPLLFETGWESSFDVIVVVVCGRAEQLRRVMSRDRLDKDEAELRIAAQLPLDEKARRADFVISTDESTKVTDSQVDAVWRALTS